jgi:hypothetical protein
LELELAEMQHGLHWVCCLLLLIVVQGCAADTTNVTAAPGASLSSYRVLQVPPASNETGQTFSFDIGSFFTDELESALRTKGLAVSAPGQVQPNTLIVKCSILSYSPGTAGKKAESMALGVLPGGFLAMPKDSTNVKADLIDQQSGKVVANVSSTQSQPESGLMPPMSVGEGHGISMISSQKLVLRQAAWGMATKIDEKMTHP